MKRRHLTPVIFAAAALTALGLTGCETTGAALERLRQEREARQQEQANAAFRELLDRDGAGYRAAAAEADEAERAAWLLSIETLNNTKGTR